MKCPKCFTENTRDSRFCKTCATPLPASESPVSITKTLETTTDALARGTFFASRYEVIEELGAGGMGRVYRVYDQKIEEEVALKLIRPEIAAERRTVERFRNEIKTARKISHKNVCRTHDLGEEGRALFITMEYVRGEDLKSVIRRMKVLAPGTAVSIARQVAEGLGEAQRLGVVHRDLKPSNIMIDKDGNAKIMDFGIARSLARPGTTAEGAIIGTPEYMSPEQVEGKPADERADIYALGVILFEMVTGKAPFKGDTSLAVAHKHRYEPAPDARMLNPQIPQDLSRLILHCLEKEREARYQTTGEFLADLEAVETSLPTSERAPGRVPIRMKPKATREITVKISPRKLLIPALALIVIVAIGIGLMKLLSQKEATPPLASKSSVAVLAFADLSPDKSNEYLADGISDALINALSRIRDLRVPGRTSTFSFKGQKTDVREIGQKLNVKLVLEGSVQVVGDRLRVAAQLVNAEDGFQLWSERYDRKMEDVFAIQDEIGGAIVDTLKVEILGEKSGPLVKPTTGNLEAYNLYLQGRYFWNKRGKDNLLRSVGYFEKALAIDPKYALAYTGLANAYLTLGINVLLPPHEAFPKAKGFACQALEIDDELADAYSILASIKRDYEWDFAGAERDSRKAIEIDPGSAISHMRYALLLSIVLGRHEEAIREVKLARDLDPLSPRIRANVGYLLRFARRYDEALTELKKTLEFDPSHTDTYNDIGLVYGEIGRYEDSISHFKTAIGRENHTLYWTKLAVVYAHAGKAEESRRVINELIERSKNEYVSPAVLAAAYGALGERDIAFDLLDRAHSERDFRLTYLKTDPLYDPLRSDLRFQAILKKIGLG